MEKKQPSEAQMEALKAWAKMYGRCWKASLWSAWMAAGGGYAGYTPELQQIRNQFGPSWLESFKLPNSQARQMAAVIPFGQPIASNSYRQRDINFREKIHNKFGQSFKLQEKAAAAAARAASVGTGGISSDDPEAVAKLKKELASLEALQARMVMANKLVRKKDRAGLAAAGFSEKQIEGLFTPDFCGRIGFADFETKNNGANIRRIKQRIAVLEASAKRETVEVEKPGGVRILQNVEANRLQIFFPGKPAEAIRKELKANGFRWAPSEGAWQRMLSNAAIWAAQQIAKKLEG
jgi:hypothetical protein